MIWIFDLDFTLYSEYDVDESSTNKRFYESFGRKALLNDLLKKLKGKKYIFSNGSKSHVEDVISKMKMKMIFKKIAYSEEYPKLKPHISAYEYVIQKFKLKKNDKIYFFEDTLENLRTAKNLGWKTIYITPKKTKRKYKYVDYTFHNIETAIFYFKTISNK